MIRARNLHFNEIVRLHTDNIVDAFPEHDLRTLAADVEADNDSHEDGRETCSMIATELRIRAAVGVRKWQDRRPRRERLV